MKLSEILGWRKKDKIHLLFNGRYSQVALETALTFCDREVDREALARIAYEQYMENAKVSGKWEINLTEIGKEHWRIVADAIISTMPTWLKRSE